MQLTDQQQEAYEHFSQWKVNYNPEKDPKKFFSLVGNAGTGKSFLINYIVTEYIKYQLEEIKINTKCNKQESNEEVKIQPAVIAFTNKAKKILQRKGVKKAKTIHNLLYEVETSENNEIKFIRRNIEDIKKEHNLLIVDESSMITPSIHIDLIEIGLPILYIGDDFQLPPILSKDEEKIYGTNFSVLKKPSFILTEIHRQAKDSPILFAANKVRTGGKLNYFDSSQVPNYKYLKSIQLENFREDLVINSDLILCGSNRSVKRINDYYRRLKNYNTSRFPVKDETLIVWKNNYDLDIYNSDILIVQDDYSSYHLNKKIDWLNIPSIFVKNEDGESLIIKPVFKHYLSKQDEDEYQILMSCQSTIKRFRVRGKAPKFNYPQMEFLRKYKINWESYPFQKITEVSFGRALTVHKAQGSEANKCLILNESLFFKEYSDKWLYTAITRCKESMVLVDYLFPYGYKHES
jgi:exodeoxyribonuclease-5